MRIFPVTPIDLTLSGPMAARDAAPPRSPGLHMSEIYGALYQELEPKRFSKLGVMSAGYIEAGLALEEMLEEGLVRRLMKRPGEFFTDEGIAYSPDGLLFDSTRSDELIRDMTLCETKCTWMSCRDCPITEQQAIDAGLSALTWNGDPETAFPDKFSKYFCQMMAYSYHLGTTHARLYTFFVNGDYRPPKPCFLAWDVEFSQQELAENWQMLIGFAREKGML